MLVDDGSPAASYSAGAFTVTIELKVDIRDAAAWGRLDQALTRLAEGKKGPRGSSGGSPAHPPHAASAPSLRGSAIGGGSGGALLGEGVEEDMEEEEELLEPLSPDASAAALGEGGTAEGGGGEGGGRERRGLMGGIRARAASKLRQLAETTATKISRWVTLMGAVGGRAGLAGRQAGCRLASHQQGKHASAQAHWGKSRPRACVPRSRLRPTPRPRHRSIPLRLSVTFSRLEGPMCAWLPPPPGNRLFYSFVAPPLLELTARPEVRAGGQAWTCALHHAPAWTAGSCPPLEGRYLGDWACCVASPLPPHPTRPCCRSPRPGPPAAGGPAAEEQLPRGARERLAGGAHAGRHHQEHGLPGWVQLRGRGRESSRGELPAANARRWCAAMRCCCRVHSTVLLAGLAAGDRGCDLLLLMRLPMPFTRRWRRPAAAAADGAGAPQCRRPAARAGVLPGAAGGSGCSCAAEGAAGGAAGGRGCRGQGTAAAPAG